MSLHKIELQDTHLNVEVTGSGPVLFLVHGFPLNHEMWQPQIETFSSSMKVIAPDLRGHGLSPPTAGEYSMDLLADDCAEILVSLEINEPVILCGLSMGGYVVFSFFRRHPSLVAGLILAATRAGADTPEARVNRDKAAAEVEQQGPEVLINNMLPVMLAPGTFGEQPQLVDQVKYIMSQTSTAGMISALKGMKSRPDSTLILGEINVPTLILHGADDQIIPFSEAETLQAGIANSTLAVIPEAGHLLNLEQPRSFNRAVSEFIKV